MQHNILVVDDDTRLRNLLVKYLGDNGFVVASAKDSREAREIMAGTEFDIIIVDVMMPDENGVEFTKAIRQNSNIPILMLTAMGEMENRIAGLEAGADDYLAKPFEPKELLLRLNNILKRSTSETAINSGTSTTKQNAVQTINQTNFGEFTFNFTTLRLKKNSNFIHLTESEAKILAILCKNIGNAISRDELCKNCGDIDSRSIDVLITRLRRKIESNPKQPQYLQTVRNYGYILHH